MSKYLIEVENLYKSFGKKEVLKGINISLKKGESLVVIGGSGTGKSVLIKNIAMLMEPDSGSIKFNGINIVNISEKEKEAVADKMGFLFQGGALFDSLSIWENVAFKLIHNEKLNKKDAKEVAIEKLKIVGLKESVADLYPSELSGGMQKRASLARTIAYEPEVVFFDEPTTGLDPIMSDVINDLIIKCTKELKITAITITHDMVSTRKIADRVAMLYDGKIIWEGNPEGMYESNNKYLTQFVYGKSEGPINFLS